MHVLHVIESLEFGGAEKVVVHLANSFSKKYKISVCVTKRQGELINDLNDDIDVYFLDTGEGNNLDLPKKLIKLINDENVDVVHSHNWGLYIESAIAVLLTKKVKLVYTIHGHYTLYSPGLKSNIKIALRHLLEKIASYKTHKLIPVSDSIKEYIKKDIKISESKLLTIPNGISGLDINLKKDRTNASNIKFITVGRIAKVKNHEMLLKAFHISLKKFNNIHLTIVGDGPELNNLKQLSKHLNISDHVEFTGFRNDIDKILANHDVFLMSSDYEGVSIAVLEAMSLAMPVIATDVGGNSQLVLNKVTGFIVEKNNEFEFSNAINILCSSPESLARYGSSGFNYFKKHFHEDVVLDQYMEIYESCKV